MKFSHFFKATVFACLFISYNCQAANLLPDKTINNEGYPLACSSIEANYDHPTSGGIELSVKYNTLYNLARLELYRNVHGKNEKNLVKLFENIDPNGDKKAEFKYQDLDTIKGIQYQYTWKAVNTNDQVQTFPALTVKCLKTPIVLLADEYSPELTADSVTVLCDVTKQSFGSPVKYPLQAPIQRATGTSKVRKSSAVTKTDLYYINPGYYLGGKVYNLGQELPNLGDAEAVNQQERSLYFSRGIDTFFTNKNYLWAGNMEFNGIPGTIGPTTEQLSYIENGDTQAIINSSSQLTKLYTYNCDQLLNRHMSVSWVPNWSDEEIKTSGLNRYFYIDLSTGSATLPFQLSVYAFSSTSASHTLKFSFNDSTTIYTATYTGNNNYLVTTNVSASELVNGLNKIKIWRSSSSYLALEHFQVSVPISNSPEGYNLEFYQEDLDPRLSTSAAWEELPKNVLRLRNDSDSEVSIKVNGATFAVDYTTFGSEKLLPINDGTVTLLPENKYIFFTNYAANFPEISFQSKQSLQPLSLQASTNYVALTTEQIQSSQTKLNDLFNYHRSNGLTPQLFTYEELTDRYGGGIHGPSALYSFSQTHQDQLEYIFIISSTIHDHKMLYDSYLTPGGVPDLAEAYLYNNTNRIPGIPGVMIHPLQAETVMTDDYYTNNFKIKVGRLPIWKGAELDAWVTRMIDNPPNDKMTLLGGAQRGINFHTYQMDKEGELPSSTILFEADDSRYDSYSSHHKSLTKTLSSEISTAINIHANATKSSLGIYQGHGHWSWLDDQKLVDGTSDSHIRSFMPSSWIMATCYPAYYCKPSAAYEGKLLCHNLVKGYYKGRSDSNSSDVGIINMFGATAVAAAFRENELVTRAIQKIKSSETLSWGALVNFLKLSIVYDDTMKVYTLLGDPGLPVFSSSPRRVSLNPAKSNSTNVSLTLTGDWENKEPYIQTLKLQKTPIGSDTWENVETVDIQERDLYQNVIGIKSHINVDISNIASPSSYDFRVVSSHSYYNTAVTTTWTKFDFTAPARPAITKPTDQSPLTANNISCEASWVYDNINVQYQFTLTAEHNGEHLEFISPKVITIQGNRPNYTFSQYAYPLISGLTYSLSCKAFDQNGNYSVSYPVTFTWNKLSSDEDNNGIDDSLEIELFGRIGFAAETYYDSTSQSYKPVIDTNNDGISDQDSDNDGDSDLYEITNGTHPFEFEYTLTKGWNMLSLPFHISNSSLDTLANATISSCLAWDGAKYVTLRELNQTSVPMPMQSFWVYCNQESTTILLSGGAPADYEIDLKYGWNMVGMGRKELTHPIDQSINHGYLWENSKYHYLENGTELTPLKGYWFHNSNSPRKIDLDQ